MAQNKMAEDTIIKYMYVVLKKTIKNSQMKDNGLTILHKQDLYKVCYKLYNCDI